MSADPQSFVNNLSLVVESKVLNEGWQGSEENLRTLLKKEKLVKNFKKAFNAAVLNTFCDSVNDLLALYKIPEKWEKLQDPSSSQYSHTGDVEDSMIQARISIKQKENQHLQELMDAKLRELQVIKQRLQFLTSSTPEKKSELIDLQNKADLAVSNIERLSSHEENY